MPLVQRGEWELYDTARVFDGFRTWKVRQSPDAPDYQVEARSPKGPFYAAGEACVAFECRTGLMAGNLMREFPSIRLWSESDDGTRVLHMDPDTFRQVAARVHAYRKRVLSAEERQRRAEHMLRLRAAKDAAETPDKTAQKSG